MYQTKKKNFCLLVCTHTNLRKYDLKKSPNKIKAQTKKEKLKL